VPNDLFAGLAGLLYGFSPYMVAESTRHPHVTLAMFPPVALILLHEILVRQRRSPVVIGGLLGATSAIQLLTGEEILATTVLVAAGAIALLVLLHPRHLARVPHALAAFGTGTVSFGLLAAYPLLFQFLGPRQAFGTLQPPNRYVSDLAAFVVPPQAMFLSTPASVGVTSAFTGNASENGAYLGIPLILLVAAAAVLRWRQPAVRWAALLTVGLAVLSLGPQLHVGGHVTAIPLPWALVQRLPLMENVLPARLMLFAFLGIGIILADVGDAAVKAGPRQTVLAVGALLVALVPLFPRLPYASTPAQPPAFFSSADGIGRARGGVVLVTPFSNSHSSSAMYWQASAGYSFRMPEGEAFVPGPSLGPSPSYLQTTLMELDQGQRVPISPRDRARALHDLSAFRVSTVVAGPSPGHDLIVAYFTSILGRPPVHTKGVDVWWNIRGAG
jgi:hypothetical protein